MAGESEDLAAAQKMAQLKKITLKKILSRQASERLSRIRMVKPELAEQLENYLVQLFEAGKIKGEVSDEQIKMILEMVSTKKDYKIIR